MLVWNLTQENLDLWDWLEILENIIGKQPHDYSSRLNNKKAPDSEKDQILQSIFSHSASDELFLKNKDKIISIIYSLSKDKSILNDRIEQLEKWLFSKDKNDVTER